VLHHSHLLLLQHFKGRYFEVISAKINLWHVFQGLDSTLVSHFKPPTKKERNITKRSQRDVVGDSQNLRADCRGTTAASYKAKRKTCSLNSYPPLTLLIRLTLGYGHEERAGGKKLTQINKKERRKSPKSILRSYVHRLVKFPVRRVSLIQLVLVSNAPTITPVSTAFTFAKAFQHSVLVMAS